MKETPGQQTVRSVAEACSRGAFGGGGPFACLAVPDHAWAAAVDAALAAQRAALIERFAFWLDCLPECAGAARTQLQHVVDSLKADRPE